MLTPNGTRIMATVEVDDGVWGQAVDVTEGVQALYDIVVQSMDWGSGFLTVEDALPVVEIAKVCGFDGIREAEAYLVERERMDRADELRPVVTWGEAAKRAAGEIGCQGTLPSTKYGQRCRLPEGHEGPHLGVGGDF